MAREFPAIPALEQLMETERRAILAGDFPTLRDLAPRKEKLIFALGNVDVLDEAVLTRLRAKASANQRLLQASMQGLSAAKAQFQNRMTGRPALRTYDRSGHQQTLGASGLSTVERRA